MKSTERDLSRSTEGGHHGHNADVQNDKEGVVNVEKRDEQEAEQRELQNSTDAAIADVNKMKTLSLEAYREADTTTSKARPNFRK